jgi:hypothetical protein
MIAEDNIDEQGTAYHEAGRAVVGAARGRPPLSATIIPDGAGAGGAAAPSSTPDLHSRVLDFTGRGRQAQATVDAILAAPPECRRTPWPKGSA